MPISIQFLANNVNVASSFDFTASLAFCIGLLFASVSITATAKIIITIIVITSTIKLIPCCLFNFSV